MVSFDTMVSVGESKRTTINCTWNATLCCSSRPKGAHGSTHEAFVLILHVCLSPPDSNSNDSIRGGGGGGAPKGLVHNLLLQFFTLGSSKTEVLEITSKRGC